MLILKIIFLRIKQYFEHFRWLWQVFKIFNKYFKLLNFFIMLWVAPMDFKIINEFFNALVDESVVENSDTEKEPWLDNERKLAIVALIICVAVCIWVWSFSSGSGGLDLSSFNRILPETPSEVVPVQDAEPSLLDVDYAAKMEQIEINSIQKGPIQSKHW